MTIFAERTTDKFPLMNKMDKKQFLMNRMKVITNIILIAILLAIAIYMILNVEALKSLNGDVCKLCMQKTGAVCSRIIPPS
jgi:cell division protein FtsB